MAGRRVDRVRWSIDLAGCQVNGGSWSIDSEGRNVVEGNRIWPQTGKSRQ